MQRSFTLAVAVACSLAITLAARAQTPDGMPPAPGLLGNPGNPLMLVMAPAVQTELKLTEAQRTKIYSLSRTIGQRTRDIGQSMLLSGVGDPQTYIAARTEVRGETDKALGRILDKKQQQRLMEISLRAEGPLSVTRPEIAEKLNVNNAQGQAIQGVMVEMFMAQRQMLMQARFQGAYGGGVSPDQVEALRLGMLRLRRAGVDRIGQILDRKQKAAFDKMLGAPFDLGKLQKSDEPETPDDKTKTEDTPSSKEKDKEKEKDAVATPADEDAAKADTPKPATKKTRRARAKNNS